MYLKCSKAKIYYINECEITKALNTSFFLRFGHKDDTIKNINNNLLWFSCVPVEALLYLLPKYFKNEQKKISPTKPPTYTIYARIHTPMRNTVNQSKLHGVVCATAVFYGAFETFYYVAKNCHLIGLVGF